MVSAPEFSVKQYTRACKQYKQRKIDNSAFMMKYFKRFKISGKSLIRFPSIIFEILSFQHNIGLYQAYVKTFTKTGFCYGSKYEFNFLKKGFKKGKPKLSLQDLDLDGLKLQANSQYFRLLPELDSGVKGDCSYMYENF